MSNAPSPHWLTIFMWFTLGMALAVIARRELDQLDLLEEIRQEVKQSHIAK